MKYIASLILHFVLVLYVSAQQTGYFDYSHAVFEYATDVKTPNNSTVNDTWRISGSEMDSQLLSPSQLYTLEQDIMSNYNGAQLLRGPDYKYNCHGYAWHMMNAHPTDPVWMGWGEIDPLAYKRYINDNSYIEVPLSSAEKIVYENFNNDLNHSAIYDTVTDSCISKWGNGPLVKHLLTELNSSYYNEGTIIHCYRRANDIFIIKLLSSTDSIYYINNLPSGMTVTWEFNNSNANNYVLYQDSPFDNQCTISNVASTYINGILIAKLYLNNLLVYRLEKSIEMGSLLQGTYSQVGGYVYNEYISSFSDVPFSDGSFILVNSGCDITLVSDCFRNSTVMHNGGSNILNWNNNGQGVITFTTVTSTQNIPVITVTVTKQDGSINTFYIRILRAHNNLQSAPSLRYTSTGGVLKIELVGIQEKSQPIWSLSINDCFTGKCMYKNEVVGNSHSVSSKDWKAGVYMVKVVAGEEEMIKKIIIK